MSLYHFLLVVLLLGACPLRIAAQVLTSDQRSYLSENSHAIFPDSTFTAGNWQPVLEELGDRRIVAIGEFNHGSREVFLARNDLIRALHQQLGFDLILFESGIGEVGVVDLQMPELSPRQLTGGFFSGWRTAEFRDLMVYAREQGIRVAGFDIQRTGGNFTAFLSAEMTAADLAGDSLLALEERFQLIKRQLSSRRSEYDSVKTATHELIAAYQELLESLSREWERDQMALIERTLSNRMTYLSYMLTWVENKDWNARWQARDEAMAD